MPTNCPFCELEKHRILYESQFTIAFLDGFPVSPGHTLIIPKRHVGSFFETTDTEKSDLISSLDHIKKRLDTEFSPDSYNIGLNDGQAAGQTVPHLHVHLIPRYLGDCEDPRGGIRWIIPEKARYWE